LQKVQQSQLLLVLVESVVTAVLVVATVATLFFLLLLQLVEVVRTGVLVTVLLVVREAEAVTLVVMCLAVVLAQQTKDTQVEAQVATLVVLHEQAQVAVVLPLLE
jgi:hypothetical protein